MFGGPPLDPTPTDPYYILSTYVTPLQAHALVYLVNSIRRARRANLEYQNAEPSSQGLRLFFSFLLLFPMHCAADLSL